MSGKSVAGPNASNPIDNWGSVFFVLIAIMPPGLYVAVVSDSMVVSAGWVGEGLGAIRARIGLLAGMDVLVCFEVELGREALAAVRADNRANLQVNGPDMPLHQTRARLKTTLVPACVVPNALGLSPSNFLDIIVGVDGCGGAGGGRLRRLIFGGKGRGGRRRRRLRGAPGGVRVVGEVATVKGVGGRRVGVYGGRRVEGNGPTPGLLVVVGGVGAGSDSPLERWGAVSEGARDELGVCTNRMPAHRENLEVVHGERGSAIREDVRWTMLVSEG
jgi:hypothetical protein